MYADVVKQGRCTQPRVTSKEVGVGYGRTDKSRGEEIRGVSKQAGETIAFISNTRLLQICSCSK